MKSTTPSQFNIKNRVGPSPVEAAGKAPLAGKLQKSADAASHNPAIAQKPPNHGARSPTAILSTAERTDLALCEATIERGWAAFVQVGKALATIRDRRLYREQSRTFEEYCREKWQYAKSHAYRLIGAAEVIRHLSPIGDIPVPKHEAQVRPLIGLDREKARAAWQIAAKEAGQSTVTQKLVLRAVTGIIALKAPSSVACPTSEGRFECQPLAEALEKLRLAEAAVRAKVERRVCLSLLLELKRCLMKIKAQRNTPQSVATSERLC
jgi:hypothetical protein